MKPILFNTEMVRAILDGRKTVTRRVVKPQPKGRIAYVCMGHKHGTWGYPGKDAWKYWGDEFRLPETLTEEETDMRWTPPCRTDDILYVRETWYKDVGRYMFKANYSDTEKFFRDGKEVQLKWHPSIHMPKEAARLFLRVTDVRVERLQDIDAKGIRAEGTNTLAAHSGDVEIARQEFALLWDSTIPRHPNKFKRYPDYWDDNPWVWVIEFERCEKPEED